MLCCYHHTDMDGKSAAYVIHRNKPDMIEDSPYGYIPTNYGDNFDKHTEKDDVFIVDVSISEGDYSKLINTCKTARSVTWIDHHATSLQTIAKHKEELQRTSNLTYFVSTCACGAALAYAYLHIPQKDLMDIRNTSEDEFYNIEAEYKNGTICLIMSKRNIKSESHPAYKWYDYEFTLPRWLYHVDDFDCWKKLNTNSDLLKLAFDACDTRFTKPDADNRDTRIFNNFYENLNSNPNCVGDLIKNGRHIHKYIHSKYSSELGDCFEWERDGVKFLCKNGRDNSWEFKHKIKEYPACILFHYSGKTGMWSYSVYSDESSTFDCSAFAAKFGGGGHVHASGFSTKYLIFTTAKEQEKAKLSNTIFLGGTCGEDTWRQRFIKYWKNSYIGEEDIELFNPVVEEWTDECRLKEDKVKATARINLFVITPEQSGPYSFVEAVESAITLPGKTMLLIYNDETTGAKVAKSVDAVGARVVANGGIFKRYDSMQLLVNDVIDAL